MNVLLLFEHIVKRVIPKEAKKSKRGMLMPMFVLAVSYMPKKPLMKVLLYMTDVPGKEEWRNAKLTMDLAIY